MTFEWKHVKLFDRNIINRLLLEIFYTRSALISAAQVIIRNKVLQRQRNKDTNKPDPWLFHSMWAEFPTKTNKGTKIPANLTAGYFTPRGQSSIPLKMSVKVLITFFIVLIPLKSMCDSDLNITHKYSAANSSSGYFNRTDIEIDSHEEYNSAVAQFVFRFLIPTVALIGVCGNVVVLVVWSAERAFNPTTFLMKCLAVSDIALLLVFQPYYIIQVLESPTCVSALFYCRMVSAHTTLGVVVTRWVAVHKPLRVHSLLTKRRVVGGYVLVLLWCLIPFIVILLIFSGTIDGISFFTAVNMIEAVYLVLPILLLVGLNMSQVYTLCSHRHSSSLGRQQQQQVARAARSSQLQQLVKAVLCLSVTTVLAYPLGVVCRLLLNVSTETVDHLCKGCFYAWLMASFLPEVINSSINIIYYSMFVSRFRRLCRRRCMCCLSLVRKEIGAGVR